MILVKIHLLIYYFLSAAMKKSQITKVQVQQRIQALPKKSKYLSREEIKQRIEAVAALNLPIHSKNALRR